ncbi:tagaturonate reductase [Ulvibacterium marinum]|uniref:tagaturonate reductase n=1 Tax=Ulvibacterium marinum TaxID=2419782 RepID=UPI002495487F|nr:tagaturonate reductase [Ulvibacterium marinum]
MNALNRSTFSGNSYTERILQFGEGNFLRAFADWMIHEMNQNADFDAGVVVVQPIEEGMVQMLNDQEGLYTLFLNGIKDGEAISEHQVIDCIQRGINPYENYADYLANADNPDLRFIISNTTEAGIAYSKIDSLEDSPQKSFPGKLTALLYRRFQTFEGDSDKGLILIPCELIDRNGDNLKRIVLQHANDWDLSREFIDWIEKANIFCNTLVDRIVPGYPKDKIETLTQDLGYKDNLIVEGEQFHLWVIEGPESIQQEFPAKECGLNVVFTDNMEPYRTRKVRILNGAHTSLVPVGYLYGIDKVRESLEDLTVGAFLKDAIFNEICPTLDLPKEELDQFANDVLDRFRNPYLEHALLSISLNSVSKFKTRVLPSILEYIKRQNNLPKGLLFSLAALIAFYKGERNGASIPIKDNDEVLDFFKSQWASGDISSITKNTLMNTSFWGKDLTEFTGLLEAVESNVQDIVAHGMVTALTSHLKS